jgi:hypothetical protein
MPRATPALGAGLLASPDAVGESVEVGAVVAGAAPHASSGSNEDDHPNAEVQSWLAAHWLSAYSAPIVAAGYDKLIFLRGLNDGEVESLVQTLKMPHPHARAFRAALAELDPTVVVTVPPAAAAPPPPPAVVLAEPTPKLRVGEQAWLRIPDGPWAGKWVPCKVEQDYGNEYYDVKPNAGHRFSCKGWVDPGGAQFRNRPCPRSGVCTLLSPSQTD